MKIILRHALANYDQGVVSLAHANDITQSGMWRLRKLMPQLTSVLPKGKKDIAIQTSPYGRTGASSKYVAHLLSNLGYNTTVRINKKLKGPMLNYDLFETLVEGGTYLGVSISANLTNPGNLTIEEYYHQERTRYIPQRALATLPKKIIWKIANFEPCSVTCERLETTVRKSDADIYVGHEEGTWNLFKQNPDIDSSDCLWRGHFLGVEEVEGKLQTQYWSQHIGKK